MFLDLREIIEMPGGSVPFECVLEGERLSAPSILEYKALPHAVGRVFNEAGVLHLEGSLTAEMHCICDRCGDEFDMVKETPLYATIVEQDSELDSELFQLEGDGIDLTDVLETLYILDMETKYLCKDDCKGLCSMCGKNLNHGACECRKQIDPRFAVFEQLLDNIK